MSEKLYEILYETAYTFPPDKNHVFQGPIAKWNRDNFLSAAKEWEKNKQKFTYRKDFHLIVRSQQTNDTPFTDTKYVAFVSFALPPHDSKYAYMRLCPSEYIAMKNITHAEIHTDGDRIAMSIFTQANIPDNIKNAIKQQKSPQTPSYIQCETSDDEKDFAPADENDPAIQFINDVELDGLDGQNIGNADHYRKIAVEYRDKYNNERRKLLKAKEFMKQLEKRNKGKIKPTM